jgi:hypothetical protein
MHQQSNLMMVIMVFTVTIKTNAYICLVTCKAKQVHYSLITYKKD